MLIDNICVQCNYCKSKIRMRFQMGYFDIPFDFCCPECGVHINGIRKIVDEHTFELHNATSVSCGLENVDYYADFSVELPHSKIRKYVSIEEMTENGFSPFLMTTSLFTGDTYSELVLEMRKVLEFRDSVWPRITPLYDLFFNKKIKLTREPLRNISEKFTVHNELDVMMALHQSGVLGLNHMLPEGSLQTFMDLPRKIYQQKNLSKLDALVETLGGKEYFESIAKRLVKIYSRWLADFEKYIPVVMLSLGDAKEKFNRERYGIATTSFEEMKAFYADSYELILEMVDVPVFLNNMVIRGDYGAFSATANVKSIAQYRNQTKSERIKSLIDDEPFSKAIPLNRNVRNAIAHYNYEFDAGTQKISFIDRYKNKENSVEMHLIDLALLCYDNMTILLYLDELMYSLRKWDYRKTGMRPHICKS